jgi:tetratricopeptide (TPR) repeat protein
MSYTNLGTLYRTLGRLPDSLEAFRKALALQGGLVRTHPKSARYKGQLAVGHVNMGVMYGVLGEEGKALESYRTALKLQKEIAEKQPGHGENLRDLALSYQRIGYRQCGAGNFKEGLPPLHQAHSILKQLVENNPNVTEFQTLLAVNHRYLGHAYRDKRDTATALKAYGESQRLLEKLAAAHPEVWPFLSDLGLTYFFTGLAHGDRGKQTEQLAFLRRARAVEERLVQSNPENMHYRSQLSQTLYHLGNALGETGRTDPAGATLRQAVEHQRRLFDRAPQVVVYARELSRYLRALGDAETRRGRVAASLRAFREGQTLLAGLLEAQPRNVAFECDLSDLLVHMERAYRAAKQPAQARDCLVQARAIRSRHVDFIPHERHMRAALGSIYFDLALVHFSLKRRDEELRFYEKSRAVWVKLLTTYPDDGVYRRNLCGTLHNMGLTLAQRGRPGEGTVPMRQAIAERRKLLDRNPKDNRARMALAGHYEVLARFLREDRKPAEAVEATLDRQKLWPTNLAELFSVACDLALAAKVVGDGKTPLTTAERTEQARYCALAVEALHKAVDSGFHDLQALQKNPDLALLRDRDDFKAVLTRIMK